MKNQNFLRVLNYIEENIHETLSLKELSEIAGYSIPQFYRLFRQLTGDTVNEYVLRRKMSQASLEVKENNKSISDIAYEYGFQSHDVFTRAFQRVYGITPSMYRNSNILLHPMKILQIADRQQIEEKQQMVFSIEEKEEFQVVGLECKACTWDSDGAIGDIWSEFLERLQEIQREVHPITMYGICEEETCKDNHFIYMAAIAVDSIDMVPIGMSARTIPARKYLQASVPQKFTTPDAYTCTINYAKSLGYQIEVYDQLEEYDGIFQDPDISQFKLLVPIK